MKKFLSKEYRIIRLMLELFLYYIIVCFFYYTGRLAGTNIGSFRFLFSFGFGFSLVVCFVDNKKILFLSPLLLLFWAYISGIIVVFWNHPLDMEILKIVLFNQRLSNLIWSTFIAILFSMPSLFLLYAFMFIFSRLKKYFLSQNSSEEINS